MGEIEEGTTGLSQAQLDALGEKKDEPVRLISRDDILGITDTQFDVVHVPEWGGHVRVRSLTGVERDAWESSMVKQTGKKQEVNYINARAGLCARAICDANGNRMFSDGDIVLLGQKSAAALNRVFTVASRLSQITEEDIEELEKNSASDRSDG